MQSSFGTSCCGRKASNAAKIIIKGSVIHLGTLTDSEKPEDSPRKKSKNTIQKRIDFTRGGSFRHSRLLAKVREKVKGEGEKGRKIPLPFALCPQESKRDFCKRRP